MSSTEINITPGVVNSLRQYMELEDIEQQLYSVLHVDPYQETTTHMGVRLATENAIKQRKDYLAHSVAQQLSCLLRECDSRL